MYCHLKNLIVKYLESLAIDLKFGIESNVCD